MMSMDRSTPTSDVLRAAAEALGLCIPPSNLDVDPIIEQLRVRAGLIDTFAAGDASEQVERHVALVEIGER